MDDLLQEFIAETRETLEALAGEIVAWEADPADRGRLDAIFRFVHTVKGSCGFLDLPRLARLSHAAEDVLAAARTGERTPDPALVDAVLAIVDRIGQLVEAIADGSSLDDSGEDGLIAALAVDAAPAMAATATAAAQRTAARSVRLGVELLDRMMSGMSDMVLARNELVRKLRDDGADPRVEAALERLSATVAEMRDAVTRTRMQKIDALFAALPRMVRDTAASLGKAVTLAVDGGDVELDREMVEMMRDPLAHIIRNAIDHGLESPTERRASGKRETGRLTVGARQSGNRIIVEVADDGRGVDVDRLVAKLALLGGRSVRELSALSERDKLELIFAPGLTSKDEVTAISGRGVGMDVVRANIEQVGGRVELANTPGRGLTVAIHVPLTLSIIATVIVGVGEHRFALPRQAIEEIVARDNRSVRIDPLGDGAVATIRGRRMPLVTLAAALGLPLTDTEAAMLVIVEVRGGTYALAVDAVFDIEELVIKPAAPAVMATGLYAGQTLPDTGLPMLLLDAGGIAERQQLSFAGAEAADEEPVIEEPGTPALLFEDTDGRRRAIALTVVDRVEPVASAAIQLTGGRWRLTLDGRTVPLVTRSERFDAATVPVLRLHDGETEIGYAVARPLDIVTLPRAVAPARGPGMIAGVVVVDGEQIEVIDPHWMFASEHCGAAAAAPICLLHADAGGWMAAFLRPALEAAGYRVTSRLAPGEQAAAVLALDDDVPAGQGVVTLSRKPGAGIYRYDRAAVIAAVADRVGRRTA